MVEIDFFNGFQTGEEASFKDDYLTATSFAETAKIETAIALVARNDGTWVGHVLLRCAADEADVVTLYVSPNHRQKGLGQQLFMAALAEAKARGVATVFLEVRISNTAAARLYQKCGFQKVGERPHYYQNPPEDAALYKLSL